MEDHLTISPEEYMSLPRSFYHQITHKPTEVIGMDLDGKTAIVTRSNTGIGFETSRQLLNLGLSKLILAVRDEEKGKDAAAKLSAGHDLQKQIIEVWKLDLSIYDTLLAFVERTKALDRIDMVILNAGITPAKFRINKLTGHSECIKVNYLSTALLAILLLPVLKTKRANQPVPSRLTFVSSETAGWTSFEQRNDYPLLAALDKPEKVDMVDHMFISKLLGQFFIEKLAEIVPLAVLINSTSPAVVYDSEFNREHDKTFLGAVMVTGAAVNHGVETHGHFLSFQKVVKMAPVLFTDEGKIISEQLWQKTMAEFLFAKVEDILKSIGN